MITRSGRSRSPPTLGITIGVTPKSIEITAIIKAASLLIDSFLSGY